MYSFFDEPDVCKCRDLDCQFEKFHKSNSKSLLKTYLNRDLFDILKTRATPTFGANIKDIIQSGLDNIDSKIGVYAPDAESYSTFEELYNPIIETWHEHKLVKNHPNTDFGTVEQLKQFTNLDPMGLYVKKIILSCSRNLVDYPFTPLLAYGMFQEIESKIQKILKSIVNQELSGSYFAYRTLSRDMERYLMKKQFLFQDTNKYLRSAKAYQSWPIGRGVFINNIHDFMIWVNESDHLRFISMDNNGHLGCVYRRLVTGIQTLEKELQYQRKDNIGYVTLCPSNLGTAFTASVYIKLPKLSNKLEKLQCILKNYNLRIGEKSNELAKFSDIVMIFNQKKLGISEIELMSSFQKGILEVITEEVGKI